jgi:hypothetical protein
VLIAGALLVAVRLIAYVNRERRKHRCSDARHGHFPCADAARGPELAHGRSTHMQRRGASTESGKSASCFRFGRPTHAATPRKQGAGRIASGFRFLGARSPDRFEAPRDGVCLFSPVAPRASPGTAALRRRVSLVDSYSCLKRNKRNIRNIAAFIGGFRLRDGRRVADRRLLLAATGATCTVVVADARCRLITCAPPVPKRAGGLRSHEIRSADGATTLLLGYEIRQSTSRWCAQVI